MGEGGEEGGAGKCETCGGERSFEFQILPQMLSLLKVFFFLFSFFFFLFSFSFFFFFFFLFLFLLMYFMESNFFYLKK